MRDNPSEKSSRDFSSPSSYYEKLKQREATSADPKEIISLRGLHEDSLEFSKLQSSGVNLSELQEGKVPREKLIAAGYVFINRIGGGEKPIISAEIALPGQEQNIDFSGRVLLTQAELDGILSYQSQFPEKFGTGEKSTDEVRQDMLVFLEKCLAEQGNLRQKSVNAFKTAQRRILDNDKYTDPDTQALRDFFQELSQKPNAGTTLSFMMDSCLQGIDLAKVRGLPIEMFGSRLTVLNGTTSPFLDSGFHFEANPDVTIYPNDPSKTRRLNMVVVHLLSRGLNEMGKSLNNSHDQSYITSAEYVNEIQKANQSQVDNEVPEEVLDIIAMRILAQVKTDRRD